MAQQQSKSLQCKEWKTRCQFVMHDILKLEHLVLTYGTPAWIAKNKLKSKPENLFEHFDPSGGHECLWWAQPLAWM